MKAKFVSCLVFLLLTFSFSLSAQTFPEYQSLYVNDYGNILDAETEARIVVALQRAKEERDQEITVLTINSKSEYGNHNNIEGFATELFNQWGIGDSQRNDGVMVLIAVQDREMRIELGEGFPPAADRVAKAIIDSTIVPQFRNNNYALGVELGVTRVIDRLDFRTIHATTSNSNISYNNSSNTNSSNNSISTNNSLTNDNSINTLSGNNSARNSSTLNLPPVLKFLAGLVALLAGGFGVQQYLGRRSRTCSSCGQKMRRLNENDDDAYLSVGQIKEEHLNSKNYDVWYCDFDRNATIVGHRRWFSSYSLCDHCGFRTVRSQQTTLRSATTFAEGEARADFTCEACQAQWSKTIILPRINTADSNNGGNFGGGRSSTNSGRSFSGGRSSGGGASGRW